MKTRHKTSFILTISSLTFGILLGFFIGSKFHRSNKSLLIDPNLNLDQFVFEETNLPKQNFDDWLSFSNYVSEHSPIELSPEEINNAFEKQQYELYVSNRIDDFKEKSIPEYFAVFKEIGVDSKSAKEIAERRVGLLKSAIDSGELRQSLIQEKQNYDVELKQKLTPEQYILYKDFELSKSAASTLDLISNFSKENNSISINPTDYEELISIIQKHNGENYESWDGPYDPLPDPRTGEHAAEGLIEKAANLLKASTEILTELNDSKHLQQYAKPFEEYYTNTQTELENYITILMTPPEEQQRQFLEKLKNNSFE